jgi:hypothetical protein
MCVATFHGLHSVSFLRITETDFQSIIIDKRRHMIYCYICIAWTRASQKMESWPVMKTKISEILSQMYLDRV